MQFTTSFVLAALPFLSAAQPFQNKARADPKPYSLLAIHSGDEAVHNQPISAANENFYIGIQPNTSCPSIPDANCPAGNDTGVLVSNSIASLSVDVPGGQSIFVSKTGALSFTPPHSHLIPDGAAQTGFTTDASTQDGNGTISNLILNGFGSQGWLACPSATNDGVDYQIFANITGAQVSGTSITHCHDIAIALLPDSNSVSAYEYN